MQLRFCSSPVALPVLFRLWRGKGTASQVELAAQMLKVLTGAFPGRIIHGVGDAAFHGRSSASGTPATGSRRPWSAPSRSGS